MPAYSVALRRARPVAAAAPAGDAEEGPTLSPIRARRQKTVVLVDDDPQTREAAVAELLRANVPVRAFGEGQAALGGFAAEKPDVIALEIGVLIAFSVLFSTFTSPTLGALFTLGLFVGGNLSVSMLRIVQASGGNPLLEWLSLALPALGLFNLRGAAVHGLPVASGHLLVAGIYAVFYVATALVLAAIVFRRRGVSVLCRSICTLLSDPACRWQHSYA